MKDESVHLSQCVYALRLSQMERDNELTLPFLSNVLFRDIRLFASSRYQEIKSTFSMIIIIPLAMIVINYRIISEVGCLN